MELTEDQIDSLIEEKVDFYIQAAKIAPDEQLLTYRQVYHIVKAGLEAGKQERENPITISSAIEFLKERLEINAGRLAEPLLKQGKKPQEDDACHKAFLAMAHLNAIEEYLENLSK